MLRRSFLFFLVLRAYASVIPIPSNHTASRSIYAREDADPNRLNVWQMKYEIYGAGQDAGARSGASMDDLADAGANFLQNKAHSSQADWKTGKGFSRTVRSDMYTVAHYYRVMDGLPVINSPGHVVFRNSDSKVMAIGYDGFRTFTKGARDRSDSNNAFSRAERQFKLKRKDDSFKDDFWYCTGSNCVHVSSVEVCDDDRQNWRRAFYDSIGDNIMGSSNYAWEAAFYTSLKLPKLNPDDGFDRVPEGSDKIASPLGWQIMGGSGQKGLGETLDSTQGNNVWAAEPHAKGPSFPDGLIVPAKTDHGPGFNYVFDPSVDADRHSNLNAALTNSFQTLNTMHDIAYRYGFIETNNNFQWWNPPTNSQGGDAIDLVVTPSQGVMTFTVPPAGHKPRMWLTSAGVANKPTRHAGLDNTIVVHEFAHGIVSRLTGGGTSMCMQSDVGLAMAEGWGDALAFWAGQTSKNVQDIGIGSWLADRPQGIRRFKYSPSKSTNGLTYSSWKSSGDRWQQGEIFAEMLIQFYALLVGKHGFNSNAATQPDAQEGNVKWLRLYMDSLMIQPCNPTLPDVRNALMQADNTRYKGENRCLIWNAFAARGLGIGAENFIDSFSIPADCPNVNPPPQTTTQRPPPPPQTTTQPPPPPPPTTTKPPPPTTSQPPPPTPTTSNPPQPTGTVICPSWFPSCSDD